MPTTLTARDIIRVALEVEQTGMTTYRDMAARTEDEGLKKLLDWLAREEESHVELFSRMFKEVEVDPARMPDPGPDDQAYLQVLLKSVVFEGPQAGIKLAQEAKNPTQMLEFALKFERDSMFLWMKLYRLTTREYQPLIENLMRQEEEHIRDIDHLLSERRAWDRGVIHIRER